MELGWPLAGPLDGTIDLPKRNPISWNVSESMIPFPGKTTTQGTSVIRLEVNETAEFVIENSLGLDNASEPHPWHFHGHSFWVVGRGQGGFNEIEDVPNYNLDNPILRDTVIQQGNEWVALRFVANNPGVWYFHCHIEAHLAMGMGFVVVVSPNEIGETPENVNNCDKNGLIKIENDETPLTDPEDPSPDPYPDAVIALATVLALVIVVLLVGAYFVWSRNQSPSTTEEAANPTEQEVNPTEHDANPTEQEGV